jgi:glycerol dehydrogenase
MFTAPYRYVQGPGALNALADVLDPQHKRVVVLVDERVLDLVAPPLRSSLDSFGARYEIVPTNGEVTDVGIGKLAELVRVSAPAVIVAAGGGKTLDKGKGVARQLNLPVVTVPTIASNDGPTSRIIATYDEDHLLVGTPQMTVNPYAVVVDTTLIANAPKVFLLSGIGDALAKRFEADACMRGSGLTANETRPLLLPSAIGVHCFDVLLEHSSEALADVARQTTSPALERVVEAVVLMSGLAFENGGLSLAHSMTRGLMSVPGAAHKLHGLHVAYALLVQLMHERASDDYSRVLTFFGDVGLPASLADLGAQASVNVIGEIAEGALTAPHMSNCAPRPSKASLIEAIRRVEAGELP